MRHFSEASLARDLDYLLMTSTRSKPTRDKKNLSRSIQLENDSSSTICSLSVKLLQHRLPHPCLPKHSKLILAQRRGIKVQEATSKTTFLVCSRLKKSDSKAPTGVDLLDQTNSLCSFGSGGLSQKCTTLLLLLPQKLSNLRNST